MRLFSGELLYCIAIFASTIDRLFPLRHSDIAAKYVTRHTAAQRNLKLLRKKLSPLNFFIFYLLHFRDGYSIMILLLF